MTIVGSMPVPLGSTGPAPFSSSRATASASRTAPASTPTRASRASQAKSAKGPNSDHRKEQNRIASRNYREKRKQKLALLRQILDVPAGVHAPAASIASDVQTGSIGAATVATGDSASLGLGGLPAGLLSAYMAALPDTLPAVFPGVDSGSQAGMLDDLLNTGTSTLDVLPVHPSQAASSSQPSTALIATTASSAWTAANSTSHPSNPFTWLPSGQPLVSTWTGTNDINDVTLAAAECSALDIPLRNPWTVPFSSDLPSLFLQSSPSTTPPTTSLTPPSSSTPSSSMSRENMSNNDVLSGSTAETLQLGSAFDLALGCNQMLRPEYSAATFFAGIPTGSSSSFAKSPLPSRPSPHVLLTSFAPSGGNTGAYSTASSAHGAPAPSSSNSAHATGALPGPLRRTRKRSKPVARAILQYVRTLPSHQKRLILQALLDEGGGEGGGEGEREGAGVLGAGADERVEEVEENDAVEDMEEDDADTTCRQVADRWTASIREKALASASAPCTHLSIGAVGDGDGDGDDQASFYSAFSSGFGTTCARGRAHRPPTFMTMTLQCRRLALCMAILHNSEACGLPDPAAILEAPCQDDASGSTPDELQSPFALAADEARAVVMQGPAQIAAVVAAVRQNLEQAGKTPPRDLQPVDAQILVAHHPYIDVIPFRGFRARALALLAAMEAAEAVATAAEMSANLLYSSVAGAATPATSASSVPCLLDEDELCYDMTVADGLICWGSEIGNGGTGVSSQAMRDSASSRDMRAGVPWDMRSWEPQVWFLKKYWYLVGGWDDDMWRNCRWWHSMRGEDLDYSVFAAPGY